MFGSLRSPTWHVPLPWLTGESAPDAALWREHLANRRRMGAELAARGVRDVPWSSWRRLQGVVLTCVTFGLWIVAGVASVALFALAPVIAPAHAVHVRGAIAAYYALALVYAAPFNQLVYDYAASLEVGAENGWKLIVKVRHDADRPFDPHRAAIPRPKPPVSLRPPPLPPRVPTSSDARRTLHPTLHPTLPSDHLAFQGDVDCTERPHVFCSHPHGLFCAGVCLNLIFSARGVAAIRARRLRLFVHSLLASAFPVVKDWLRSLGFLPATRANMLAMLREGESAVIVPGGVREVVWAGRVDRERLYLSQVYGFVAVAIKTGAPLVPVYTFGESLSTGPDFVPGFDIRRRLSYRLEAPLRYLSLCQRWLVTFPNGRLVTVVGDPVDVGSACENPSRERVRETHARYCDALLRLIEETKEEAGYGTQVTEIV